VILAVAWVAWRHFFPNPEKLIRERLDRVAALGSFRAEEPPATRLLNVKQLAECFTADAQVRVGLEAGAPRAINGRDEIQQAALFARSSLNSLEVGFADVSVEVAEDRRSATARMTARVAVPGEKDLAVQELEMGFARVDRAWLISRVQSVKTLTLPGTTD